ncbi:MAG: hypothetical protein J07HX64_00120 [halophilic archaeon J07HX64]|nr:MAG: hypothetical protein J07HX64_00120 [halophilic archaeon J07HX64]
MGVTATVRATELGDTLAIDGLCDGTLAVGPDGPVVDPNISCGTVRTSL